MRSLAYRSFPIGIPDDFTRKIICTLKISLSIDKINGAERTDIMYFKLFKYEKMKISNSKVIKQIS